MCACSCVSLKVCVCTDLCAFRLPELMHQVCSDASSRGPQGVSDGDGTSVHVALLWVQAERLGHRQVLGGERLVHLSHTQPSGSISIWSKNDRFGDNK